MAALKNFKDLESKEKYFSKTKYYIIDTKEQFDNWFEVYTSKIKEAKKTDFIFRGMGDASYKLYTSAQRVWIQNDMKEWAKNSYLEFMQDLVEEAKRYPLLKKVFDLYNYTSIEREFSLLSILQHYGAPTPLMDLTYNINVSLFFATENIKCGNGNGKISNYFSIYRINKAKYRNELFNLIEFNRELDSGIKDFEISFEDEQNETDNSIFYISDFDEGNASDTKPNSKILLNTRKPLTSIYNQNIIPQEGLFIFNPYSERTIDDVFNFDIEKKGISILELTPFACFNIKKDLADYIRRRINEKYSINAFFIYPELKHDAQNITNKVLNEYSKL